MTSDSHQDERQSAVILRPPSASHPLIDFLSASVMGATRLLPPRRPSPPRLTPVRHLRLHALRRILHCYYQKPAGRAKTGCITIVAIR